MGLPQTRTLTYADYLALPEQDKRYELLGGELWMMAGAGRLHQLAVAQLSYQLMSQLQGKPCQVYFAPFDVRLAEPGEPDGAESNVVQPDLMVVCDRRKETPTGIKGAPDLVIEVLSPGGSASDLISKRRLYERAGVVEYWVFDPEGRTVHRHVLLGGAYRVDVVLARARIGLHSMPLQLDFDLIELAEGFEYPATD